MRFGLFYHLQVPRPWAEDSDERALRDMLYQIELADKLGFDYAWEAEHHFLEEYSHSPAPEVVLAAAAARTRNIRLAHGIVSLPTVMNHPVRVAERIATLDLVSGGRVDLGTGQGSSQLELGAFGVERATKREQWREAIEVITRLLTEDPFTGHRGTWVDMPPRNMVPKSKQKPYPPLWVACSNYDTIKTAAKLGMGALSMAFLSSQEAKEWVDAYYQIITSEECVPLGPQVNPNIAIILPFMCHPDEQTALDRGIDGAHFYSYSFLHYYLRGTHRPGATDLSKEFAAMRDFAGLSRNPADSQVQMDENVKARLDAMRRCIGTPDQIASVIRGYEEAGVDQIIFQAQLGSTRHEDVCESLELFAAEVMPEFKERREADDHAKQQRLAEPVSAALARVPVRDREVPDYEVMTDTEAYPADPPFRH